VTETCATCHNRGPHALWRGSQHEARNVSCVTCHSVHQPKSAKAQLKAVDQRQQCMSCHRDKVAKLDRSGHMPVREGKMECASCHNPHGSTNVRLLKAGNSINESCASCHTEKRGPFLFEHAAINGDSCATCYDPHGSNNDRMLVAKLWFLCQRCHNHTRHPSTIYDGKVVQTSNRLYSRACVTWHTTGADVFRISVHTTGHPLVMLRGLYENRQRQGEQVDADVLAEVGELAGMRHFDVADRDWRRVSLIANVMPAGILGLTASAGIGRDAYPNSPHGLQSFDSNQYSAGVSVTPDDRYNLTASYGWERYRSLQRSRNATSAADQANPIRDWTTDFTGKVHFLEAALDVNGVIERTAIRLSADWNRSNDTYLYGLVTGSPLAVPEQLPPVKNELFRGEIAVSYEISRNLSAGVTYWLDDYQVQDFALGPTTLTGIALPPVQEGQPVVATNALLLGYLYRPYTAHAGIVRLTYRF
jgi:DmsE family decaheme c-type cytochrome